MQGSEKQIKWAEDIKAGAFAEIEAMKRNRQRFDDAEGKRNNNLYPVTWEAIETVEIDLKKTFAVIDKAADLIDKRHYFTSGKIRQMAEAVTAQMAKA